MVDAFMPDVEVHIAFNAGYTTPAASRTWTDVSSYVELADRIAIAFGRQDERSTAGANTLSLTLDNSDGRFTADRSASPYYPNVKIGRPIRVRVTPPGGTASTRFVGFVDEWPVEWDGSDAYAAAKVRASSRLARLGLTAKLQSMLENDIRQDRPDLYYTMGDPEGSVGAEDSSGNGGPRLLPNDPALVTFGTATGPAYDGLTAADFAGGYLAGGAVLGAGNVFAVECFFRSPSTPASSQTLLALKNGFGTLSVLVNTTGRIEVREDGVLRLDSSSSYADGSTHHVALYVDNFSVVGGGATLYVDGTSVDTYAPDLGNGASKVLYVGGGESSSSAVFVGTIAHVAAYQGSAPSSMSIDDSGRIASHATVGLTGLIGERTDERLGRVLGWAGVASTEVTTATGVETMTHQQTSGQSVVDVLRDVESTEGGVLFDGRDGNVTFHNRSHRYLKTASATLDMSAQHVGTDYAPKLDRSTLLNDVEVSNPTTDEKARATNTTSSGEYGVATGSATSVADSYDPLQQKAAWLVASYAEPRSRVPSLTVDVLAHQGLTPSAQTLLGVTVGDLLAVTNAPTQSGTTSPSYFVEGYTETIGPESYELSFNLSPTYPALSTFVLDSATRGLLDTNILAL